MQRQLIPQQLIDPGLGASLGVDRLDVTARASEGPGVAVGERLAGHRAGDEPR